MASNPCLRFRLLAVLTASASLVASLAAADAPRERASFNADWRFTKGDPAGATDALSYAKAKDWILPSGLDLSGPTAPHPARPEGNLGNDVAYTQPAFDDNTWRQIDVPHDWAIEGPFIPQTDPGSDGATARLPWMGIGWYRKHFPLAADDANRRIFVEFDGAMSYAEVWCNGQFVGGWPYGYSSWELDLTPYVKAGADNVLAVRLENPPQSSRWYPGAGIYRNVWLLKTAPVHVAQWGTFVTTPLVSDASATANIDVVIQNDATSPAANVLVGTTIFLADTEGHPIEDAVATAAPIAPRGRNIAAGKQAMVSQSLVIAQPKRWSTRTPQRYVAVTTVTHDGNIVDRYETPFGIRTIQFTADRGFLLNGERVPLNGVCDHHDLGALGAAVNFRALQRQLEILREMGCNAIRTSHNPPAPELLELADRMGFVIMDEAFDCWARQKRAGDYHLVFNDWHERDLRALIRRDRNHPSVVLWSIGNEIPEQGSPEGWKLAAHLAGIVREEDRTRPITSAFNNADSGYNGFQTAVDVAGYNYRATEYASFHRANPQIPLVGSETSSCVSARGEYKFPVSDNKADGLSMPGYQVSSYDLSAPRWAWPPDVEFKGLDENPFVAGEFVWTGFDYLGEPTPYGGRNDPARSSYFGIVDLAGFKKDRFFLYQARWRPDLPMAHLLPHWNWPDRVGEVTPVHVYTSGDEAELFLNGQSLGRKKRGALEYRLRWDDVKYQPGELRVVAYKNGAKWAEDVMRTAGSAAKLTLTADRATLRSDGSDLAFVTLRIEDKDGTLAPRANNRVKFEVAGPADLVATDNGDATSFESFQAPERAAFNGLALAIVRPRAGATGEIVVRATSAGLTTASLTLVAK
jgi:beta-galactosidase